MAQEGPGVKQSAWESSSAFSKVAQSVIFRVGQDGLNLKKSLDALSGTELSRMYNCLSALGGSILTRPGQTALSNFTGTHHSIGRLNDPQASAYTRFHGVGTVLVRGTSGLLTQIDNSYSGDPLTLLQYRPPLASSSYMFVGDRSRMSKISRTGPRLPIGLPKPAVPATAIGAIYRTSIASFDASDGTGPASWTVTAGFDQSDTPVLANPASLSAVGGPQGDALSVATAPGAAAKGYYSVIGVAKAVDLTSLQGGAVPATDDDEVHIWIRVDHPNLVQEIRYYLVISDGFVPSVVPGTDPNVNTDAYVKAFQPNDFSNFVVGQTATQASAQVRSNTILKDFQASGGTDEQRVNILSERISQRNLPSQPAAQLTMGSGAWSEFGVIGVPLRRSDFLRIGTTSTRTWANVTGIIISILTADNSSINVAFDDSYLTGGAGPDTAQPGDIQLDYRVTNFDPRTGAESNPSDTQSTTAFLDASRQPINIIPAAYGDANIRQRIYRRGGSITDNWYFVGTNTGDGALFTDTLSDAAILAAGAVDIDNDQPVTTIDSNGNAVYNQPIPVIWGPVDSLILGCGDPYRPGDVYWCKPGFPDSWPAANHVEVCAPSEELMAGGVFAGQAFVFSRERCYMLNTNLANAVSSVVATPTDCTPGMVNRWGLAIGPNGIYFVARDGIRMTRGGNSEIMSDAIRPLFNGQTVNGYLPVDMTQATSIKLAMFNNDLWFLYKDTGGTLQCLIYSTIYNNWRAYTFANPVATAYAEPTQDGSLSLLFGSTNGNAYTHSGTTDAGVDIAVSLRSGAQDFGYPRGDTLFGDVVVDADMKGQTLTATTYLNNEQTANSSQAIVGVSGRRRYIFDPFGISGAAPQKARNLSIDLAWSGTSGLSPVVEFVGASVIPQPNVTMNRITSWDSPGNSEVYLIGVWLDYDAGKSSRTVNVEYELNGVILTAATLTVNASNAAGRRKEWFSWPVVKANMIRLRPADNCVPWELYGYDWLAQPEPPRISGWDTNWENKADTYYTGVDLECDTFGQNKTIQFYVDQTLISTQTVNASGRRFVHVTLPWGRGHIYRFVATDANPGLLYKWTWITDPEPGEQTNWNQNFTVAGTMSDKWLKGAIIQCDTFGVNKTVTFEVDGVVVNTSTVNTNGRKVVEVTFPQSLGRVFRMFPTDANPGRLYSLEWIFDEEPLALSRWETQELDLDDLGWKHVPGAFITIKSTSDVTLTLTIYGQSGILMATQTYTIPSTGGLKQKVGPPTLGFNAAKGILYKFVFTSSSAFWLYREESYVVVQPWGQPQSKIVHPFGNDDLDLVRGMHHANLVAGKSGGGEGIQ